MEKPTWIRFLTSNICGFWIRTHDHGTTKTRKRKITAPCTRGPSAPSLKFENNQSLIWQNRTGDYEVCVILRRVSSLSVAKRTFQNINFRIEWRAKTLALSHQSLDYPIAQHWPGIWDRRREGSEPYVAGADRASGHVSPLKCNFYRSSIESCSNCVFD